jgi:membrane protein YdbS with pleckstrin-like domain
MSGNNDKKDYTGYLIALLWLLIIAINIGSGIIVYDWIEPESFFGGILFMAVWVIINFLITIPLWKLIIYIGR